MRKIKKFKIPIYSYDILRKAKKHKVDLFALGLAEQEAAKEYIASIAASLEPSTVFEFLAPENELAQKPGPLQGGSMTCGVITLGRAFEDKLNGIKEVELRRLAETAALVFAETGIKVVSELINQEASVEAFDLGPSILMRAYPQPEREDAPPVETDMETIDAVLNWLNADKIGVASAEGALTPKYSTLFAVPWLARKKRKPATAGK